VTPSVRRGAPAILFAAWVDEASTACTARPRTPLFITPATTACMRA
jgi:hypothetical protein